MLPLARFPVLHSADREALHRNIRSRFPGVHEFAVHRRANRDWFMRINSLDLGRGKVTAVETGACSLSASRDGLVRVFLPLAEGLEIAFGAKRRSVGVGQATFSPLDDFRCVYGDDYRGLILGFPQRLLEDVLADFGWTGNLPERIEHLFARHDPAAALLGRQVLALVRSLDEAPDDLLSQKRFLVAQEELLLLQIARLLAAANAPAPAKSSSALYLARAMDYMRQHMFEEIGPASVARAAGCSLRNLQWLFQREFGQTITGSLRQLRLQSARDRLAKPQDNDTITGIATDCGFTHLSDFARHYRSTFGELPSTTLARVRGQ